MGYYTRYTLLIQSNKLNSNEIITDLRSRNEDAKDALDGYGNTNNTLKWYEHEEDMQKFSKKYPEALFVLYGEGEEAGDIWTKYFKDGKKHIAKAKIEIDEFDENKLIT